MSNIQVNNKEGYSTDRLVILNRLFNNSTMVLDHVTIIREMSSAVNKRFVNENWKSNQNIADVRSIEFEVKELLKSVENLNKLLHKALEEDKNE